jgi:hypothetical protein
MSAGDFVGWLAAGLTLLTFSMRSMIWLRLLALAANVCFIAYGMLGDLYPVVTLHLLLIPCNLYRLGEIVASGRGGSVAAGSRGRVAAAVAGRASVPAGAKPDRVRSVGR